VALRRSSEVALRILIIDDSEDVQVFIATLLRLAGYTDLVTASTLGEAALYLAERDDRGCSPLDLILLDVMMPQMDG
jgi:osomolarity two-component system sensor histidine kinase SLN1